MKPHFKKLLQGWWQKESHPLEKKTLWIRAKTFKNKLPRRKTSKLKRSKGIKLSTKLMALRSNRKSIQLLMNSGKRRVMSMKRVTRVGITERMICFKRNMKTLTMCRTQSLGEETKAK